MVPRQRKGCGEEEHSRISLPFFCPSCHHSHPVPQLADSSWKEIWESCCRPRPWSRGFGPCLTPRETLLNCLFCLGAERTQLSDCISPHLFKWPNLLWFSRILLPAENGLIVLYLQRKHGLGESKLSTRGEEMP